MRDNSDISTREQILCVERILSVRRRFNPQRIREGSITREESDKEIRRLEAVLQTLKTKKYLEEVSEEMKGGK